MDFINTGDGFLDLINGGNLGFGSCKGICTSFVCRSSLRCIFRRNDFQKLKGIAGGPEGLWGFLLPDAHDKHTGLSEPLGQLGKVRIAGYQAEAVYISRIQNIHGVDDHGGIGGIFAGGVAVLLDGIYGPVQEHIFPRPFFIVRPVAVNAFIGGDTNIGYLIQNIFDIFGRYVVCVDQYCKSAFILFHMLVFCRFPRIIPRGTVKPAISVSYSGSRHKGDRSFSCSIS